MEEVETARWFRAAIAWVSSCLAVLAVMLLGAVPTAGAQDLELSADERAYIAARGPVSVGVVADNDPYSFYRNGNIMGWTVDLIGVIGTMTGLDFKLRMGSWSDVYGQFRAGGLDVIADISETEERSRFITFTDPYHLRRTVLYENVDQPFDRPLTLDQLKQKRIGIIRDIYYADALREIGVTPVTYATYRDLMAAVAFGWVDGVLAAEMTGNFFLRENGFTNVANAGTPPLTAVALEDFRLGVLSRDGSEDAAMLADILEKAITAMPTDTLDAITTRWLSYRSERSMSTGPLRLLPEEQAFVKGAPPLKIGFSLDYEPFSYLDNGRGKGFAEDITQYIASATGLVFERVYDNWSGLLRRFREGELDVVTNISYTDERAEFTLYSDLYHRVPNAVFLPSGAGPYEGLESLEGKSIGISRDIYYADALKARFEDVREFDSREELMQSLSDREIDVVITSLSNGTAIIRQQGLINIQIGGEFLMDGVEREDLRFGVSPRYPYLRSIIDHALESISLSRWEEMERRWLGPPMAGMETDRDLLSGEERKYLADKGTIRVCVEPRSPPYTVIDEEGYFSGAIAEIIGLMGERGRFDRQIKPVALPTADAESALAADCDVLPFAARENMRDTIFDLAPPYLDIALAVAAPLQAPFVSSLRELSGQRVGIVPTHVPADMLKTRYPDVELVEIDSEREGLDAIEDGDLDAVVGPLDSLAYLIAGMNSNDVKISGRIPEGLQVVVATVPDEPYLGRIFGKLVVNLDPEAIERIISGQKLAPFKRAIDYRLLLGTAAIGLFVLLLSLYWVRKLRSLNRALNKANSKLHEVSITDGMTGLYNRSYFVERGEAEFDLSRQRGVRFTVAMLDVDHFKPINDRMGHVFGDACLKHLADILNAHFLRSGDLVARYGGEEFVAYTLSGEADQVRAFLERLRERVAVSPAEVNEVILSLTVSIGFYSAVPGVADTLEQYIDRADSYLYEAKRSGRNRVNGNL
ncbi:transporter substrate-binding domain-containing protein [Martelella lutilitoris]|uniref:diguanylate cyclase n=1 Tax=Martelella lutilitoris TaxID=2583532 RepID=A0A5C4JTV8_9HYPH|nr:transporter substrate-binding domain-containing protein [Martelella lutilitoris]TNB48818.1 transporter substrate-binding domain-containing protein [Martelella lutilitoris]